MNDSETPWTQMKRNNYIKYQPGLNLSKHGKGFAS